MKRKMSKKFLALFLSAVFMFTLIPLTAFAIFNPATDIVDVPTGAFAGVPLTLTGTVVPDSATNKNITWSVKDAGTTGATIAGNILSTTAAGTVTVTAAIEGQEIIDSGIKAIATGNAHSVVIKNDGTLWGWGTNGYGQIGNDFSNYHRHRQIGTDNDWEFVSAGSAYTILIKEDGSLWSLGINDHGQLGDGTRINRFEPVRIGTDNDWAFVSAGNGHTMAIKTDGSLWAWGYNNYGQLGDGTTTDRYEPVRIGTDNNWAFVSAGNKHTMAIKTDGSLWAWGWNYYRQLGIGPVSDFEYEPIKVGTDNNWAVVSAGEDYTIAIKTDGSLWAWGYNFYGFGAGYGPIISNPTRIGTDNDWRSVAASFHLNGAMAIKTDGSLWGWGYNSGGILGDGTTTNLSTFTKIGTDIDWVYVVITFGHTMALKNDGSLWSWGLNEYGQVGNGTRNDVNTPIKIELPPTPGSDFTKDFEITVTVCSHTGGTHNNVTQGATCEDTGLKDIYCSDCGTVLESDVEIPATGHTYDNGVCTECGEDELVTVERYEISVEVEKLNGNQNKLIITITEYLSNGTTNVITASILIDKNSAGTYDVGGYKIYVDTKGNTQIRDLYVFE